ncbi:MAG: hypothetical protein ACTHZM_02995 [Canibacter sp.]
MRVRGLILQVGAIPPSGGPLRDAFLEENGLAELIKADTAFETVSTDLEAAGLAIPALPELAESTEADSSREIQRVNRSRWLELGSRVGDALKARIEPLIRESESSAVRAFNYLEDHELGERAHRAIHHAAFVRRGLFGCPIILRDGLLWTACSTHVAHIRVGFSAEIISDFECSLCGHLVEDCDHDMGSTYEVTTERDEAGLCGLHGRTDCDHQMGEPFRVTAIATARNIKATTRVAIVDRPRYPQARFGEITIGSEALAADERLRRAAEAGDLHDDECLGPCKGLSAGSIVSDMA